MLKNLVKQYSHPEEQYLQLIRDLLDENTTVVGRNGTTLCNVGNAMYFRYKAT